MANERLRARIAAAQLSLDDVASRVGVDPKTVERWVLAGRVPHRTHRWTTAAMLGADETYLWPSVGDEARTRAASNAEFVGLYPHRGAVPVGLWRALVEESASCVDLLAYAALFLPDGTLPDLAATLEKKATGGTRVRIALGDPDCDAVARRGEEEGIGHDLAARIRISLTHLEPARHRPGVEVRLHDTTLYASLYRFDDDVLVNTHTYGAPAAQSPVLHLRRVPGGRLFDHYLSSFDRLWDGATAVAAAA